MSEKEEQADGFPMVVIVEGGLALVAMIAAWLFSVPVRELVPPVGEELAMAVLRGLVATMPMLAAFWWLVHSDRPTFRELRRQVEVLIGQILPNAGIAQLALVAALAGVGEELLFRGVMQTIFGWWTTPIASIVITSLIFGAMHALSKTYFLLATGISLIFGWMTWYYHDIVGPMVAHTVYDFVALMYLSRLRLSADNAQPPEAP